MSKSRLSSRLLTAAILALFIGVALYLRIYLPYHQVFVGEWIKFTGKDAYYHMRLVDNLVHNFPHLTTFDPYFIYPGGGNVGGVQLFNWFLAATIWVIGLGSPTQHIVDVVGVYFPAVLGALTVIPVYFLGKELLGRWAGIISAGLIAIFSGEFLGRSILGFTDHHVAEVLFTTTTMLFLFLAIKAARQRQLTFSHFRRQNWATSAKPVLYSLLAGVFLGIYLLTWSGGLLFVFIVSLYFVIQFTIDHLRHRSTDYLCLVGIILFLIPLTMFLLTLPDIFYLIVLVGALVIPLSFNGISRLMTRKEIKPAYYPLALVGLGLAGLGILRIISPSLFDSMIWAWTPIFAPSRESSLTTSEMQPFLFPQGSFSLWLPWGSFTTSFFLSLICLGILIYLVIKRGDAEISLIVVWGLVILAATLSQRRFAYYLAVNVALLSGYLCWQMLRFVGFKKSVPQPAEIPKRGEREKTKAKPKTGHKGGPDITPRPVTTVVWAMVIFFLVFYPNIGPLPDGQQLAIDTAKAARSAPSDAWCGALSWLRENTPDPFGNPDFYYELYKPPAPGESYQYPKSAYGVLAWWDYGFWITRIARRLPNANPGQGREPLTNVARFFSSQEEDSADRIIEELGSEYIIPDNA